MRTVMDKHDVAHTWANRLQGSAKTSSGNLFFEQDNIYSYGYHFMIAKHVENSRGERAILITKQTYSKTTSAQVAIVKSAACHLDSLTVPDPSESSTQLFKKWFTEIKHFADHLSTARKPEKYLYEIRSLFKEAQNYAAFFDLEMPGYLFEAGQIENQAQYTEVLKRETDFREAQAKAEQKARLKIQRQQLKEWRAFKRPYLRTADGYDYLRFNLSTRRVETTQSVEIPEETARRFYAVVMDTIARGGCSDCGSRLMDRYEVLEINAQYIRVGCHQISLKEINSFIQLMGWQL